MQMEWIKRVWSQKRRVYRKGSKKWMSLYDIGYKGRSLEAMQLERERQRRDVIRNVIVKIGWSQKGYGLEGAVRGEELELNSF